MNSATAGDLADVEASGCGDEVDAAALESAAENDGDEDSVVELHACCTSRSDAVSVSSPSD